MRAVGLCVDAVLFADLLCTEAVGVFGAVAVAAFLFEVVSIMVWLWGVKGVGDILSDVFTACAFAVPVVGGAVLKLEFHVDYALVDDPVLLDVC